MVLDHGMLHLPCKQDLLVANDETLGADFSGAGRTGA